MSLFSDEPAPRITTLVDLKRELDHKVAQPILPTARGYVALSEEARDAFNRQRMAYLRPDSLIVDTPQTFRINKATARAILLNRGLLISGPAAIGKTTAAIHAMRMAQNEYSRQFPHWRQQGKIPIVYVEAPPSATGRAVVKRFARFLGLPDRKKETLDSLQATVVSILRKAGTRLVVVDELHRLAKHSPGNGESVDVLRDLATALGATFIYAGVNIHVSDLLLGERGQQISERFALQSLTPFTGANTDDWADWDDIVRSFEEKIPLMSHKVGDLASQSRYLFDRTQGRINGLSDLLTGAAKLLIFQEVTAAEERITLELLDEIDLSVATERASEHAAARSSLRRKTARTRHS